MNRSLIIVLGALALCAGLLVGSYAISQRVCCASLAKPTDDLEWLKKEFQLSDAELARVRKLHDGYQPQCAAMCKEIAAKKAELTASLAGTTNVTTNTQQKLDELALLRARCQAQMLQHFLEVSQAMPPAQGQRYLAEMKRVTLAAHDQLEESMSESSGMSHGHH